MASPGESLRSVWTADFYNRLNDFMNRSNNMSVSGPGYLSMTRSSIMIALPKPTAPAAAGGTITAPWVPFTTQDNAGNYQANFYPGTIGGILPGNMFTALALAQSAVNYLYLAVTSSGGIVTGATITASTTYPAIAASNSGSPPASFNVPVGIFDLTKTSPVLSNIVGYGNIWVQPYVSLLTTNSSASLLTAAFTPSYNWLWGAGD